MKKIFILFSLFSFIVVTGINAQTTTTEKNQTKTNKVVVTRDNALKVIDSNSNTQDSDQTKTTTAPEKEEMEGTTNNNTTKTYNRSIVSNKQCEKRQVTVSKKTNIVTPKK
ncbi:MAG: hypothetical protein V1904_01525 [Bacteroidota bacterium]